jgi:ribosomal protein S25
MFMYCSDDCIQLNRCTAKSQKRRAATSKQPSSARKSSKNAAKGKKQRRRVVEEEEDEEEDQEMPRSSLPIVIQTSIFNMVYIGCRIW